MADISKITTLDGTTYNIKDATARNSMLPSVSSSDNDKVLKVVNGAWAAATAPASSTNLIFTNVTVAASAFEYDGSYSPFDYKAAVTLTGVTSSMIPFVSYSISDVEDGNFAPSAESYNGGIYLYSNRVPSAAITIPTILVVS